MRKTLITLTLVLAGALTACGGDEEEYVPPVKTYDTQTDTSDAEMATAIMEAQWSEIPLTDRSLMCDFYISDHDGAMQAFAEGAEWDADLISAMDNLMEREC